MQKKPSQNLIIVTNAISFATAAILGGIGVFAAIANFTKGDWRIYGSGIEGLAGTIATSFFLSILALIFCIIAKTTIKKITDADLLKKTYGTVAIATGLIGVLFVASAVSVAIYALLSIGSKSVDQGELWLNGFLSSAICAIVTLSTAAFAKKISDGDIKILPALTNIVLSISAVSAILMLISTIVNTYGNNSSPSPYYDSLDGDFNNLFDLFNAQ